MKIDDFKASKVRCSITQHVDEMVKVFSYLSRDSSSSLENIIMLCGRTLSSL